MYKTIFTYLFILYFIPFSAQEPVFKQFTTRDGLPSNEVHYVFSDSKGYMWFCTDAGIAKYNASDFKLYNTSNGMPDNTVFELAEDAKGRIWFRTVTSKVGYISNDTVFNIDAAPLISEFAADGKIISMAFAPDGSLYLGRQSFLPCSFLRVTAPFKKKNVEKIDITPTNRCGINVIVLNNDKVVFTEARNNTYGYNYNINIYNEMMELKMKDSSSHLETLPISHFHKEEDNLYYTTFKNIIKYNLKSKKIDKRGQPFSTLAIGVVSDSLLLVGSINNGVWYYDKNNLERRGNNILKNISATCFAHDYQKSLWISTLESGVFYFSANDVVKYKINNENESPVTTMINCGYNSIMVGHNDGTIKRIELNYKRSTSIIDIIKLDISIPKDVGAISGLVPITEHKVMVSGIYHNVLLQRTKNDYEIIRVNLPNAIHNWCKKQDKIILCGRSEIYEADSTCTNIKHLGHVNDRISAVCYDGKTIYVAGWNGIYSYNEKTGTFDNNGIIKERVEGMAVKGGAVYFATKSKGVIVNYGNRMDTINESTGLISNFCRGIETNGFDVWAITNMGLSKITEQNGSGYKIDNFPLDYFVDQVDIKEIVLVGDMLFFSSINNIYALHVGVESLNEMMKPVTLKIGKKFYHKGLIEFSGPPSDAVLCYEALFYKLKGKIKFRYRYNQGEWSYANQTSVQLGALRPGEYTIEVEALGSSGNWIKAPHMLKISINKPLWQSPIFVLAIIVLLSSLIGLALYWMSQRQIRKEQLKDQLKMQMIELESKSVRSQMNPHFIFNSLNTLHRFILESDVANAEKYLTRFSKLLRKLIESSTSDKISLMEEINILKSYLEIEQLRFSKPFKFEIINEVSEAEDIFIPFMLIQPFIENALWHGLMQKSEDREIHISFNRMDNFRIICVVDDNGIGREAAKQYRDPIKKKSLAIEFIRQRLELVSKVRGIDSYFKVIDKKNEHNESLGTKVEIILPILN